MNLANLSIGMLAASFLTFIAGGTGSTQPASGGPPTVGIVEAVRRPITESSEFLGRIEAVNRVNVVARVTAFLEERLFIDGAELKKGDLLYRLERGPFEADLATKQAQVAQLQAMLENAKLTTERARTLLGGPAGQQSTYDAAIANQRSLEAQVQAAQAQVDASQINLDYTTISAPIDGKIGRTAVTEGNVVGPSSGVLTTIVSQDPMYVTFPVPLRQALELRERYGPQGGLEAVVIRLRLPDGRMYGQSGKLNFVDNTIAQNTDTITVRGEIDNPILRAPSAAGVTVHELTDGEFVTVVLEGVQPIEVLGGPALGDPVRPAGRLRPHRWRRQQGRTAPHPARAVDPHHRLSRQRPRRRRQGHRRRPAASSSGPGGFAGTGQCADPVEHEGRRKRRNLATRPWRLDRPTPGERKP